MMRTTTSRRMRGMQLCLAAAISAATGAYAAETTTGYRVEVGPGFSDNIRRTADNKESETILTAGLITRLEEKTRKTSALLLADLAYLDYASNTYSSQLIGNASASGRISVIENRFELSADDSFGQVRRDPTAAVTPSNRENVNYLTAGPDLHLPLGEQMHLDLGGRYSKVSYETSPLDSTRYQGSAGVVRDLSEESNVGLRVSKEHGEYSDESQGVPYDRYEYLLRYTTRAITRTQLTLDAGYNQVKQDQVVVGEDVSGFLARLGINRRISPASTLQFRYARELSNAGNLFQQLQNLNGVNLETQDTQRTSDPFTNEQYTANWTFDRSRTGFVIGLSQLRETYKVRPELDRKTHIIQLQARRDLAPTLSLAFVGERVSEDFEGNLPDFREIRTEVILNKRLGVNLLASAQYSLNTRHGDLPGDHYTENVIWLRLSYGTALMSSGVGIVR